jgi:carbonic anhydrase
MKSSFLPFVLIVLFLCITLSESSKAQGKSSATPHFISPTSSYWTGMCGNDELLQSPITLSPPFTYLQINMSYNFAPYSGGILTDNNGMNLVMQGDFGNFIYDGVIFTVYQINFKSPSEHAIGATATKLPLEMQILAMDQTEIQANIAILFSEGETDGQFLSSFGFGDGILQHLKTNQSYEVPQPIDLTNTMPASDYFFIYQGSMTTPPCTPALWLVGFETFEVSARQLNDFPKMLLYKDRVVQTQPREVFCNFDPAYANASGTTNATSQFSAPLQNTPTPTQGSIYSNSFSIAGDNIPYDEQMYPSYNYVPVPRTIDNGDYLIVTNPSSSVASTSDAMLLDKDLLQKAISKTQGKSVNIDEGSGTKSKKKAKVATSNNDVLIDEKIEAKDKFFADLNSKLPKKSDDLSTELPKFHSFIQTSSALSGNSNNLYSMIQHRAPADTITGATLLKTQRNAAANVDVNPHLSAPMSLSEDAKNEAANKIYNILGPNKDKNGVTLEYIRNNVDQILAEYQNIAVSSQKGGIFLQEFSSTASESPMRKLLKGYSPQAIDDFGMKVTRILNDVKTKDGKSTLQKSAPVIALVETNSQEQASNFLSASTSNAAVSPIKMVLASQAEAKKRGEAIPPHLLAATLSKQTEFNPAIVNNILLKEKASMRMKSDSEEEGEGEEEDTEGLEDGEMIGQFPATADIDEEIKVPVIGPSVTNQVRSMFDTSDGRGAMAFNQEGTWDQINIWQTLAWPNTCKYGKFQSPVWVSLTDRFQIEPSGITFDYTAPTADDVVMSNDGYKVIVTGDFGTASYGQHVFHVNEIDIHHPSEHTFGANQERADFEIQLLHTDAFGIQMIISIFLKNLNNGQSNYFLDQLGFNDDATIVPQGETSEIATKHLDLTNLVKGAVQFIEYEGSLTSPPCSEGVRWFLANERGPVSQAQINAFKTIFGQATNVRGTQPLNGRVFSLFSGQ